MLALSILNFYNTIILMVAFRSRAYSLSYIAGTNLITQELLLI